MRILTIIQARMLSKRLPGKVMKEVKGKPLIGYTLERLSRSRLIDGIILATSVHESNDPLCDYVSGLGYEIFRGSEDDVLERYYKAVLKYTPDAVVRVTGDCPMTDPEVCDALIREFIERGVDYAFTGTTFAEGLDCEVVSFKALEKSYNESTLLSEREHVGRYIRTHPDRFDCFKLEDTEDNGRYRLSVDSPEDYDVIKSIIDALYTSENPVFYFDQIKGYLDSHPEVMNINSKITRNEGLKKSLADDSIIRH